MNQPLYHCTACKYTGHETGIFGHCPNDCRFEDDGLLHANGKFIELLEYDYDDDAVPNAGVSEEAAALDAFHKFLNK